MWDCKSCDTPLDANSRLSKKDCPQVVDPPLHHRYRSITGCLSYLVNMTRPDLEFAYSQLSKFVQYPGVVHFQAAERVLQYVCDTYDQGITYFDPRDKTKNKLIGWVDSDFGIDPDFMEIVSTRRRDLKYKRNRVCSCKSSWAGGSVSSCAP